MLVSTKDQGLGRRRRSYSHSHVYSLNKTARSSKLSLLSAITTQSSGSNGSNSTVTQESYNRSKSEAPRKKKSSKRRKETSRPEVPPMEAVEEAISEGEEPKNDVDVFTFLVDEEDANPQDCHTEGSAQPVPVEATHADEKSGQSPDSDSGISMDDGSIMLGQTSVTPLIPMLSGTSHFNPRGTSQMRSDWTWPEIPKPKHSAVLSAPSSLPWTPSQNVQHHFNDGASSPYAFSFTPEIPSSPSPSLSGYGMIATGLAIQRSSTSSLPLIAFRQTCEELLLGLQCDVGELDNELRRLDVCSEQSKHGDRETDSPTGRRGSWQLAQYQADLAACKVDVSRRLHLKLEQYYQLLLLSQKILKLKSISPISPTEVDGLRQWLKHTADVPSATKEMYLRYLQDEDDLIGLSNYHAWPTRSGLHENAWRTVLGFVLLLTALLLQILSDWRIKALVAVQMLGVTAVLCLPRRD